MRPLQTLWLILIAGATLVVSCGERASRDPSDESRQDATPAVTTAEPASPEAPPSSASGGEAAVASTPGAQPEPGGPAASEAKPPERLESTRGGELIDARRAELAAAEEVLRAPTDAAADRLDVLRAQLAEATRRRERAEAQVEGGGALAPAPTLPDARGSANPGARPRLDPPGVGWALVPLLFVLLWLLAPVTTSRWLEAAPDARREVDAARATIALWGTRAFVLLVAITWILGELGASLPGALAVTCLLALLGAVACRAIVEDLVRGWWLLGREHFGIGEVVDLDGRRGVVRAVSPRHTELLDALGGVHVVPHRLAGVLTRWTDARVEATVEVRVPYDQDLDAVLDASRRALESLEGVDSPDAGGEAPCLRVVRFDADAAVLRVRALTRPEAQEATSRALSESLRRGFAELGLRADLT